jgi:hypothetical protein
MNLGHRSQNTTRNATRDPTISAVVVSHTPLLYTNGADAALDRPAHVRAASSIARTRAGIALIQDDANFVAIVDPYTSRARAITLPAGEGGKRQFDSARGNKKHKLDLEACVTVDESEGTLLVALGSGSRTRRESIAIVRWCESEHPDVTLVRAPRLYDLLRRAHAFAGSELNIEGAIHLGDTLRLFGRGNGAARDGLEPINASCDLRWPELKAHLAAPDAAPPPAPVNIVRYELGALDEVPLSFTDAALWRDATLYAATAEQSPNVVDDGPVSGSAIGVIEATGGTRWTALTEPSGAVFRGKVEGLLPSDERDDRLFVVVDADDPDAASLLCTVELRGSWDHSTPQRGL